MAQARKAHEWGEGSRKRRADRATVEEIEAMPALLTTAEISRITGWTPEYCAVQCRSGMLADVAIRAGKSYTVGKAKALAALGLD